MDRKIIVIGCPGSGKSTFSRCLAAKTGIDLYHLDAIYWRSDATHISRPSLIAKQRSILRKDSFIIDGNYKSTVEMRIKAADLVFLFDLPTDDCIYGAEHRRDNRPEMACDLPVNDELIDFIKGFNINVKPRIIDLLKKYNSNVIVFHSHKEVDDFLNRIVTVTIDRPLGSHHPEHTDMLYPVNYGYVKGIIAPDGEEQDAYVLGINDPVTEYTGLLYAVIYRRNDIENKWVVLPFGASMTRQEIMEQVHFQEQYFDIDIKLFEEM